MNSSAPLDDQVVPPATIRLGALEVQRMGYGAMRLPGKDVWGPPDDPARARHVLRRAVELGIDFIDTSWYYGPLVANQLIAEALHPYPSLLVIATKLGGCRRPDKSWAPALRPEELRRGAEEDLRTLRLERLDVVHLRHMPHAGVPLLESLDALRALQAEGKIRHLALSNVNAQELRRALERTPIVAVQNMFSVAGMGGTMAKQAHAEVDDAEGVLELCTREDIAFLPFSPLAAGAPLAAGRAAVVMASVAARHRASPVQLALVWLFF